MIGVGRPISHGVKPCSQHFSQPPVKEAAIVITSRNNTSHSIQCNKNNHIRLSTFTKKEVSTYTNKYYISWFQIKPIIPHCSTYQSFAATMISMATLPIPLFFIQGRLQGQKIYQVIIHCLVAGISKHQSHLSQRSVYSATLSPNNHIIRNLQKPWKIRFARKRVMRMTDG